jgi:hypothetical protein
MAGAVLRVSGALCATLGLIAVSAARADAQDMLSGAGRWDMAMVREFMKKEHDLDVPDAPEPWRNRDMAPHLNGEFLKRLDALMAVYQAMGGDASLGIQKPDGGLRTAERQIALYKQCRRVRTDAHFTPVGDGSKPEDWEVIPPGERTYEGQLSVTSRFAGGTEVFEKHGPEDNCPPYAYSRTPAGDLVGHTGPATETWVSWHNLGLAADLGETATDAAGHVHDGVLPDNRAWRRLPEMMGELGMTSGGWWGWDPAHVEFHPQMHDPEHFRGAYSGEPLPDARLKTGYGWKLPRKIYIAARTGRDLAQADDLQAFELAARDECIALSGARLIVRKANGDWSGRWWRLDPPACLFPPYIPTVRLVRNAGIWPNDAWWDGTTSATMLSYDEGRASNGERTFDWSEWKGDLRYRPTTGVWNRQFEANAALGHAAPLIHSNPTAHDAIRRRWTYLELTSVYDVDAGLTLLPSSGARVEGIKSVSGGYTAGVSYTTRAGVPLPGALRFAWDRDGGRVGMFGVNDYATDGRFELRDTSPFSSLTTSASLPVGAFDRPDPPPEPAANPRPKSPPTSGPLRP